MVLFAYTTEKTQLIPNSLHNRLETQVSSVLTTM